MLSKVISKEIFKINNKLLFFIQLINIFDKMYITKNLNNYEKDLIKFNYKVPNLSF